MSTPTRKRPFGKVTFGFSTIIVLLIITIIATGFIMSNKIDGQQAEITSLQNQINSLQTAKDQLLTSYNSLQSQYNQLNSQYQQKSSSSSSQTSELNSLQNQIASLQNQIASLQSQLANASALIAQLQGPTGILPTYSDLSYVGPVSSGGAYWLQLSLKNTGSIPITQIFVTINSVQVSIPFTYLGSALSTSNPLPAYQTASGKLNVTPPINNIGTYPLVIQASATNGTVYSYQTTITAH
jgi:hypothetical protein